MILLDMISIINSEAFMLQYFFVFFSSFFGFEQLFAYLEASAQSTILCRSFFLFL